MTGATARRCRPRAIGRDCPARRRRRRRRRRVGRRRRSGGKGGGSGGGSGDGGHGGGCTCHEAAAAATTTTATTITVITMTTTTTTATAATTATTAATITTTATAAATTRGTATTTATHGDRPRRQAAARPSAGRTRTARAGTTARRRAQVPGGQLDPCDFPRRRGTRGRATAATCTCRSCSCAPTPGDLGARPGRRPVLGEPRHPAAGRRRPARRAAGPAGARADRARRQAEHALRPRLELRARRRRRTSSSSSTGATRPWASARPARTSIGVTMVSLGARGSGRAHAVVKCPTAWFPTFVNGGHECLVVRVWDETSDGLGHPAVGRRAEPARRRSGTSTSRPSARPCAPGCATLGEPLLLPAPLPPLTLKVGPLYGEPAQVSVARAAPHEMPWLQLRTGTRGQFPAQAPPTGDVLLGAPTAIGGGPGDGGGQPRQQDVTDDDQQVTLTTGDAAPGPGRGARLPGDGEPAGRGVRRLHGGPARLTRPGLQ